MNEQSRKTTKRNERREKWRNANKCDGKEQESHILRDSVLPEKKYVTIVKRKITLPKFVRPRRRGRDNVRYVHAVTSRIPVSDEKLEEIKK